MSEFLQTPYTYIPQVKNYQLVNLVGDSEVGKTSLTNKFAFGKFNPQYLQTKFAASEDKQVKTVNENGEEEEFRACLINRGGHDDKDELWDESHSFFILASSDSQQSFDSIDKWKGLIRKQFANQPIMLVLNDKSNGSGNQVVTQAMMQKKSDDESFEGVLVVDCQKMDKE